MILYKQIIFFNPVFYNKYYHIIYNTFYKLHDQKKILIIKKK